MFDSCFTITEKLLCLGKITKSQKFLQRKSKEIFAAGIVKKLSWAEIKFFIKQKTCIEFQRKVRYLVQYEKVAT